MDIKAENMESTKFEPDPKGICEDSLIDSLIDDKYDPNTIGFYCVNLKNCTDRRSRIEKRFKYHQLGKNLSFVEAINRDADEITIFLEGSWENQRTDISDKKKRSTAACMLSHIKAIRTMVDDIEKYKKQYPDRKSPNGGIICEDDILIKNTWKASYKNVMENLPDNSTLCSLGYMIDIWIDPATNQTAYPFSGKNRNNGNICKIHNKYTWGTQMYWISEKYAKRALRIYGRKATDIERSCPGQYVTSEVIVRLSGGHISYPPLVIEDAINFLIRPSNEMESHIKMLRSWGYNNYSDCEGDEHLSPLYQDQLNIYSLKNQLDIFLETERRRKNNSKLYQNSLSNVLVEKGTKLPIESESDEKDIVATLKTTSSLDPKTIDPNSIGPVGEALNSLTSLKNTSLYPSGEGKQSTKIRIRRPEDRIFYMIKTSYR